MANRRNGCTFKELIKASGQGPVQEITTISTKITEEAGRLITGIIDPTEAWERLNEGYGDKQLAVIAVMKDLMQLKVPAGLHM